MENASRVFLTLKENVFSAKCNRRCYVFSRQDQGPAIFPKYPHGSFVPAFWRLIFPLWSEVTLSAGSQRTGLGPPSADMDTCTRAYPQAHIVLLYFGAMISLWTMELLQRNHSQPAHRGLKRRGNSDMVECDRILNQTIIIKESLGWKRF